MVGASRVGSQREIDNLGPPRRLDQGVDESLCHELLLSGRSTPPIEHALRYQSPDPLPNEGSGNFGAAGAEPLLGDQVVEIRGQFRRCRDRHENGLLSVRRPGHIYDKYMINIGKTRVSEWD